MNLIAIKQCKAANEIYHPGDRFVCDDELARIFVGQNRAMPDEGAQEASVTTGARRGGRRYRRTDMRAQD